MFEPQPRAALPTLLFSQSPMPPTQTRADIRSHADTQRHTYAHTDTKTHTHTHTHTHRQTEERILTGQDMPLADLVDREMPVAFFLALPSA